MTDLTDLTADALHTKLTEGETSPTEVALAFLDRINAVNPSINAIVSLRERDAILQDARALEGAPKGPLWGLPIAIKDLTETAGIATTKGWPAHASFVPDTDAEMTAAIRRAGALVIGKTNTPQFGLGSHTTNPVFGPTLNPYDTARTPGGSSGGASAALAARMLPIADGSDMMGSLRNPAGWCNVYGFRPSYGVVPQEPTADSFLHQLATSGPMARTPRDLWRLLKVQASAPRAPHHEPLGEPEFGRSPPQKIAWLGDWGGAFPVEDEILPLCEAALGVLAAQGHTIVTLSPPFDAARIWEAWVTLRSWTIATMLGPDFDAMPDTFNAQSIWEIENGRRLSAADVHAASIIRSEWDRAFHAMDADICALPTAQMFPFDATLDWPQSVAGRATDTYHRWMEVVVPASLIGVPAAAVPAGFGSASLPMGLQLVGKRGTDAPLIALAQNYHEATDWPNARRP